MNENVRESLKRMLKIARDAKHLDDQLIDAGYQSTPYWELFGQAVDAIYYLIGEQTGTLCESVTYDAVLNNAYTDEQRLKLLMDEYERNKPA